MFTNHVFWRARKASQNTNDEYKCASILHTRMSNKRFIIHKFSFPQNSDLPRFLIFRAVGEMRRVQISCDICTRFLYSTKQCWIIK